MPHHKISPSPTPPPYSLPQKSSTLATPLPSAFQNLPAFPLPFRSPRTPRFSATFRHACDAPISTSGNEGTGKKGTHRQRITRGPPAAHQLHIPQRHVQRLVALPQREVVREAQEEEVEEAVPVGEWHVAGDGTRVLEGGGGGRGRGGARVRHCSNRKNGLDARSV